MPMGFQMQLMYLFQSNKKQHQVVDSTQMGHVYNSTLDLMPALKGWPMVDKKLNLIQQ